MSRFLTTTLAVSLSLGASLMTSSSLGAPSPDGPASTMSLSQSQTVTFSPAQVRVDVTLARNAYRDIHPGYTRFTDQATLDQAWDLIIESADAKGGMSEADFYLAISETLALIRCDHTKAELSPSMKANRKTQTVYLPLRWTIVQNRGIIQDAPNNPQLKPGDEIITIDGRTIHDLQAALHRYIPVDGYNDHIRDGGMTASGELMGGAVDHFGSLLWDTLSAARLEIETSDGERRIVEIERVPFEAWETIATAKDARNFKDAVTLTRVGKRGAVLSVDTFVNYRQPVDPDSLYGPVFEALESEGRDKLILDLRQNGGGSTDASQGLFSYLIDAPRQMKLVETFKTIDHDAYTNYISTWEQRAINPPRVAFKKTKAGEYQLRGVFSDATDTIKPAPTGFKGELIVLTSRNNSSGSTNLISAVRAARDVTLVGEKTGGNPAGTTAGTLFLLKLPESALKLRLPITRFTNNAGDVKDGIGLEPDVSAPDTVASLRQGRDPAMEAALAMIAD